MALARRAQQIGAPDEHVARPVSRIVRVVARQLELAGLQRLGDVVLGFGARGGGLLRHLQRVGLQLRRRRQPAHALGAHIVVDQRAIPRTRRRGRRQHFRHVERFVTPLVGVRVKGRGRVHLPRRPAPVEAEGQRQPARLRAQLFLSDIMRPAAARLADASAHHQHVDDAAVVHVHVVPVVQAGTDDHHRTALGLLRVERELAGRGDDLVARHAGDLLRPGRRIGLDVVVALGEMLAAEPAIDTIVGDEEIVDRGDQRLAFDQLQRLGRHIAQQHARMIGAEEVVVLAVAEIREADGGDLVLDGRQRESKLGVDALRRALFETPLALFAPSEADRAARHHDLAGGLVIGDGFPLGVIGLVQALHEVRRAQETLRHIVLALLYQAHQHRHVGVLAGVVLEILGLPLDVEFAQDHVAHGHAERGIGALLRRNPQIGELRGF